MEMLFNGILDLMLRLTFIIFLFCLVACSVETKKDRNVEIIINYAQSYKYDLKTGIYTIFYIDKSETSIPFNISIEEKKQIADKYYDLGIDKISGINKETGTTYIEDECMIMPKLYTLLQCKVEDKLQKIQIDDACNNFYLSNTATAKRIKQFLKFIDDIIKTKPELKNAPESNFLYL
jgi:hypothetical protein